MDIEQLKYPIGKFKVPKEITTEIINEWIGEIEALPERLEKAVDGLSDEQLDTPYRPNGWTVRQVVHHIADSHINSITRFKLGMTENNPTIKPYAEGEWAKLADSKLPIEPSMQILKGLHHRLGILLRSMTEEDLEKTFFHPESQKSFSLKVNVGVYAWHSNHHLGHITSLKERKGW